MKKEIKKLFADELKKFKNEMKNKVEELKSMSTIIQGHAKSLKRSNEELQRKMWRDWAIWKMFIHKNERFNLKTKRKEKWCFRLGTWVV